MTRKKYQQAGYENSADILCTHLGVMSDHCRSNVEI